MADKVKATLSSLGQQVQGLSPQKRLMALLAAGLAVAIVSTMVMWSGRTTNVPLLTNLTEEDASQIVAKLDSERVPYTLAAGGTAILVPEAQVHALRLKLAGEGLPKGGNVGFELFDAPNFGMSRFAEQLNYKRGLEGELRRSIRQIDAVQDARVHIVVPEQGLFREQDKQATAAITLHLRAGRSLGPGQVQAIVHLVASSVAGLSPENVTVVDSRGTILAKGGDSQGGASAGLEQQRAVEKGIEERVHAILAPIVGSQHVVVRASAVLDFARTERTTESYDPATRVVRSEQLSEEKRTGAAPGGGGVAGARSNLSGINKEQQAPSTPGVSERRSSTHNYEINKVVAHEMGAQGRLTRLSVAVLVDGVEVTAEDGTKSLKERTPAELARFEELARRAMGFDADREDQVSVQSMAFEPVQAPTAEGPEPMAWGRQVERFWPPVLALFAAAMLAALVFRLKPGASSAPDAGQALLGANPRTVRELEEAISAAAAQGAGGNAAASIQLGGAPPDVVAKLTHRLEPKLAASVLKGWLNET